MKNLLLLAALLLAAACSKNDENPRGVEIALEPNTVTPWEWRYITLPDGVAVTENDAWDIAILRYKFAEMAIRTPFDTEAHPIKHMVTGQGRPTIGTREDLVWSGIEAIDFDFETMPPVYTALPAHNFTSADGQHTYRVQFTGYDPTNGILVMECDEAMING
jgi:hypothetical protein